METQQPEFLKGAIRLGGSPEEIASKLGPLADLEGTWQGDSGWNLIAVPSRAQGLEKFTLLIHQYSETITFKAITAPVPNRGGLKQQFVTGLTYELIVTDKKYPQGVLHIENGMLLNMDDIENQPDGRVVEGTLIRPEPTIARLSSIPHGNIIIALGSSHINEGGPQIPVLDATPIKADVPTDRGYNDQYNYTPFTGKFLPTDVNYTIRAEAAKQNILRTRTIVVDTENKGSIANIPFVQEFVTPTRFQCTFWIEDVVIGDITFKQLQYSQQSDLNFIKKRGGDGDILWPHVNVNTLRKI
jgi:hypothetical protein